MFNPYERQKRINALDAFCLFALLAAFVSIFNVDEPKVGVVATPTSTPTLTPTATPDLRATVSAQGQIIENQQATLESMIENGIIVTTTATPNPRQFPWSSN